MRCMKILWKFMEYVKFIDDLLKLYFFICDFIFLEDVKKVYYL